MPPAPQRPRHRATGALLDVALWIAALLGLVAVVCVVVAQVTGIRPLVVRSGSMEPTIPTGATVLVAPVPVQDLEPGDVAALQRSDRVRVTHRVVSVEPEGPTAATVVMRGDANEEPDPPVRAVEAHRVLLVLPVVGRVAWGVATPGGGFVLGCLFTAGMLVAGRAARR